MTAEFTFDFAGGRDARKNIEKAIRKGLSKGGTVARKDYIQIISGRSPSQPGSPPGSRTASQRGNDPIKPLRKLVKKKVKNNRGSPVLRVGFLADALTGDEIRKANSVTFGRKNPTARQGGITKARPSAGHAFVRSGKKVADAVFAEVKGSI